MHPLETQTDPLSPLGIAETIFEQMGGKGRLAQMVGAKNFSYNHDKKTGIVTANFVHVLGEGKRYVGKVNLCEIIYFPTSYNITDGDTYTLKFWRYKKPTAKNGYRVYKKKISQRSQVHAPELMDTFEEHTGLYLTFAPRNP